MTDLDRHAGAARRVLKLAVATTLAASLMSGTVFAQSVDLSKWSPDYVKSIAGTKDFDAAADCGKVVPNDYTGRVSYWYTGPFEADPQIAKDIDKQFWEAFKAAYPNITTDVQSITYNELLDKFRTALLGNSAPMVIRLQIDREVGSTEHRPDSIAERNPRSLDERHVARIALAKRRRREERGRWLDLGGGLEHRRDLAPGDHRPAQCRKARSDTAERPAGKQYAAQRDGE